VIKAVLRLAIVAVLANGTWRIGTAYAKHYRFTDAVTQATQFRGGKSDDEVHARVFEVAAAHDIPVTDENLIVERQEHHTIVRGAYKRPIDLLPGFTYHWPFTVDIDTFVLEGGRD
jgi:hypothetical protein